jgi:hypothetical protein
MGEYKLRECGICEKTERYYVDVPGNPFKKIVPIVIDLGGKYAVKDFWCLTCISKVQKIIIEGKSKIKKCKQKV